MCRNLQGRRQGRRQCLSRRRRSCVRLLRLAGQGDLYQLGWNLRLKWRLDHLYHVVVHLHHPIRGSDPAFLKNEGHTLKSGTMNLEIAWTSSKMRRIVTGLMLPLVSCGTLIGKHTHKEATESVEEMAGGDMSCHPLRGDANALPSTTKGYVNIASGVEGGDLRMIPRLGVTYADQRWTAMRRSDTGARREMWDHRLLERSGRRVQIVLRHSARTGITSDQSRAMKQDGFCSRSFLATICCG